MKNTKVLSTTIAVSLSIVIGLLLTFLWSLFHAFYVTPEDKAEPASLLSYEEIKTMESFLNIDFPDETEKIYSHFDNYDLAHLYMRVNFQADNIDDAAKLTEWTSRRDISNDELGLLTEPKYRRFMNSWVIRDKTLDWWKPAQDRILYIHRSHTESEHHSDMIALLEGSEDEYILYITKTWFPNAPAEIEGIFPQKPNWTLRESELFPFKSKN